MVVGIEYQTTQSWSIQADRLLLTSEIRGLNPNIGKVFCMHLFVNCNSEKTKMKKKRPGMARLKKHDLSYLRLRENCWCLSFILWVIFYSNYHLERRRQGSSSLETDTVAVFWCIEKNFIKSPPKEFSPLSSLLIFSCLAQNKRTLRLIKKPTRRRKKQSREM